MPDGMSLYARPEEVATTVPLYAKLDHILTFSLRTLHATELLDSQSRSLAALLG
jgi:hypothetical protein